MDKLIQLHAQLSSTLKELQEKSKEAEELLKKKEAELIAKVDLQAAKLAEEKKNFESAVASFDALQKKIDENAKRSSQKVKLNVGGTIFVSQRDTLCVPGSFFHAMLGSDRWKPDPDGEYFIDRSPIYFTYILSYLRLGRWDLPGFTQHDEEMLLIELDYYSIPKTMWPGTRTIRWSPNMKATSWQIINNGRTANQTSSNHNLVSSQILFKSGAFEFQLEIIMKCCGGIGFAKKNFDVDSGYSNIASVYYDYNGDIKDATGSKKKTAWQKDKAFYIGIAKEHGSNVISFSYNKVFQGEVSLGDLSEYVLILDLDNNGSTATFV